MTDSEHLVPEIVSAGQPASFLHFSCPVCPFARPEREAVVADLATGVHDGFTRTEPPAPREPLRE